MDKGGNLTGTNDNLIDLSNAVPLDTEEELKNMSQTPVITEGFMDNSALFKEEESVQQQDQSIVSAVQDGKKDPFSVFDDLSPQKENPEE
jgi:hypothetical protein